MYVHFYLSEIYTVSSLDSKIENPSIELVNVVWFLKITSYDILRSNLSRIHLIFQFRVLTKSKLNI